MSNETQAPPAVPSLEPNPWTDADVDAAARAMYYAENVEPWTSMPDWTRAPYLRRADAVLAALAPRLVERERAARVWALEWAADSLDAFDEDAAEHVRALTQEVP